MHYFTHSEGNEKIVRSFALKLRSVALFLGIVSYLLAIAEHLLNLGVFSWAYSVFSRTTIFYLLIIVGTAFIFTYLVEALRKPKMQFFVVQRRRRPLHADYKTPAIGNVFGVKWRLFPPEPLSGDRQPWAEGPYCPECDRELEEKIKGRIFKQRIWRCLMCGREYPRPKGDVKDMVEKDFAAYLRKMGKM